VIKPGELQKIAREVGVRDQQIEKDYVLSWLLYGIAHHEHLGSLLAFKGGTVLKKVYFEDYRFSEDLDFTILEDGLSNAQILEWFSAVFDLVRQESNIPLSITENNEHQDGGINFFVGYVGPLGGIGTHKNVKVDISRGEKLAFHPVRRRAIIGYSDMMEYELLCYSLEEVWVEKLRSVMQRMQARDLYDIWYLSEIQGIDAANYSIEFRDKCQRKGLVAADFHRKLEQRLPQYRGRWNSSLANQIKDLPDFEGVSRAVQRQLRKFVP
jgi:predicted nucleotidyltransferase component of viral defense system